jgi:SH3-like domain-containing protein
VAFDLGSGKIVAAVVRAGEWVQVRDDQGRTGWVAAGNTLDIE